MALPRGWPTIVADAQARAGFRDVPKPAPEEYAWPDIESPETAAIWAADPFISREVALKIALDAEAARLNDDQSALNLSDDPETKILAKEFVEEEREHAAGLPLPIDL